MARWWLRLVAFGRRRLSFLWNVKRPVFWLLLVLFGGLLVPERWHMPVAGAGSADWNHRSFWYHPWGKSGVHKGIDIFGKRGQPVRSPIDGWVVSVGEGPRSGKTVLVLGPKWRFHYFAHLSRVDARPGRFVVAGTTLGGVGDTGNAKGKPPHLHYAICSMIPQPWLLRWQPQGWKKMFFLNPHPRLVKLPPGR